MFPAHKAAVESPDRVGWREVARVNHGCGLTQLHEGVSPFLQTESTSKRWVRMVQTYNWKGSELMRTGGLSAT